jgi:hypothetical protein
MEQSRMDDIDHFGKRVVLKLGLLDCSLVMAMMGVHLVLDQV